MNRFILFTLLIQLSVLSCAGKRVVSTPPSIEKVVTHAVGHGETWQSIAGEFLGDESRAGELAAYNKSDPRTSPAAGTAVRVPLSAGDLRSLERRLEAAESYNEGLDLIAKGDYGRAVERFQSALEIDPYFLEAAFNLAVTYNRLGLHGSSLSLLQDLVDRSPANVEYRFALGNACFHAGDLEKAREHFLAAHSIDPGHLQSLYSLAVACEKTGRLDEAVAAWREYLEYDSDSEWAEQARSHLESLLRKGGGNP